MEGGHFRIGSRIAFFESVLAVGGGQGLGSFCKLGFRGERLDAVEQDGRQSLCNRGIGLQGFELAQRAMKAALIAGLVPGEAVEFGGELRVVEDIEVGLGGSG